MLVSGVFALHMSNMVLVGSIRTVHLCDLSMHEVCRVSHTSLLTLHIFCAHTFLCCCIANGRVHCSWATSLGYSLVHLCYNSLH